MKYLKNIMKFIERKKKKIGKNKFGTDNSLKDYPNNSINISKVLQR